MKILLVIVRSKVKKMFRETILSIFEDIWPMLFICLVIIVSLRIVYLIKNKIKFIFYKEMIMLGFIIYVMALFRVVTFQDVSWSSSNFIPFEEMFRYEFGTKLFYKNVVGNMLMFVPYGFFIAYFLKTKKPWLVLLLTTLVSITIEITQLLIGRVFDVDDIILNIVGGVSGYIIYYLFVKIKSKIGLLQKQYIYNIIMVLILVLIFLYLQGVFYV